MTPADLSRLSTLLDEALDLPLSEREEWLAALEGQAAALAPTLRGLLARAASKETCDLLERGPTFTAPGGPDPAPTFQSGDTVGPYRLQRMIGQGGMGEVWLAERSDGQLKRQVALKLPVLGLRRSVLVQRFARERDIVGALAHPHIARLYDAGLADDGQPYLALEYVEGQTITAYCDAQQLDLRARVQLLLQVMDAVQYAHAHLVIHRDLKPGNVLVTADGQAMLLDFGIAKLLAADEASAESTELTQVGGRALTLEYAAPEQVGGAAVSTATDVYALGVLLYELLSGQRPFGGTRREMEAAILATEPPRPVALPVDLATIVLKAMKKAPAERFATVYAMAEDLGRWLRGEPVLAQPDSFAYRLRKFIARRRVPVAAGSVAALALLASSGAALHQADKARKQAAVARQEAERAQRERDSAQAVRDFLIGVFRSNDPDSIAYSAQPANTVRDVLNAGLARLRTQMDEHPEVKSALFEALTDILINLGDDDAAVALAREHGAFVVQRLGSRHGRHAAALLQEAEAQRRLGQGDVARQRLRQAEGLLDALGDRSSVERGRQQILRGTVFDESRDGSGPELALRGVQLLAARQAPAAERAQALVDIGHRLAELGRLPQALETFDAAVEAARGFDGAALIQTRAWATRSGALRSAGQVPEALAAQRRALQTVQALPGDHPEIARHTLMLGSLLHAHGARAEGRRHLTEGLQLAQRAHPRDSAEMVNPRLIVYSAGLRDGDLASMRALRPTMRGMLRDTRWPGILRGEIALALLADAELAADRQLSEVVLQEIKPVDTQLPHYQGARLMLARGRVALAGGHAGQARAWLSRVDASLAAWAPATGATDPFAAERVAEIRRQRLLLASQAAEIAGQRADALAAAQEALALATASQNASYGQDDLAQARLRVGAAWLATGAPAQALPELQAAWRSYAANQVPGSPRLDEARRLLTRAAAASGQAAGATGRAP